MMHVYGSLSVPVTAHWHQWPSREGSPWRWLVNYVFGWLRRKEERPCQKLGVFLHVSELDALAKNWWRQWTWWQTAALLCSHWWKNWSVLKCVDNQWFWFGDDIFTGPAVGKLKNKVVFIVERPEPDPTGNETFSCLFSGQERTEYRTVRRRLLKSAAGWKELEGLIRRTYLLL